MHGKKIIVYNAFFTPKGSPKRNGEPSKCDYTSIYFKYDGQSCSGILFWNEAKRIYEETIVKPEKEYIVDVTKKGKYNNICLKDVNPLPTVSVTQRIQAIVQPEGGYLPVEKFMINQVEEKQISIPKTLRADIVGQCVQYFATYLITGDLNKALKIPLLGWLIVHANEKDDPFNEYVTELLKTKDDMKKIGYMYALAAYDKAYRSGYETFQHISPDISNEERSVLLSVARRIAEFYERHLPVLFEMTFNGGYTETVSKGDGDVLTDDGVWDIKTSKSRPTKDHTLQILMYYIMGLHSKDADLYKNIEKLGFYNPLLGEETYIDVSSISSELRNIIETDVICYSNP